MRVEISDVKDFWNKNPLAASGIDAEVGTPDFFAKYDVLREQNEPLDFSYSLHEYPSFKGKRVLDIGCGNGYVLSKYAREGAEVFGVDITETAVGITKKRFEWLKLNGNIRVANAEELPFEDNYFDCVCSMGVLHHTPDTQKAIDEVYRVLKPGGRLILMFYHKNSIKYKVFGLMPYLHPRHFGKTRKKLVDEVDGIGNPRGDVYTDKELAVMLKKFSHLYFFKRLIQEFNNVIPQPVLDVFESRWGWFIYVKGWK